MLQSMGSQRAGHDWVTEQQQYSPKHLQAFSGTRWNPTTGGPISIQLPLALLWPLLVN